MKIHAYILAYNEEKILPYTLDHYSKICEKIIVYDNMSTDSSDEIYKRYPKVNVVKWSSNNEINELDYLNIKNTAYKDSRGQNVDWVIVCDTDEFLYHPDLLNKLKEYKKIGINVPLIEGHDMVSREFPTYDGRPLTEIVKTGSDVYEPFNKNIIFTPDLDIEYGVGAHTFKSNNSIFSDKAELKLLHYKLLGFSYVENIYKSRFERLSGYNKSQGYGYHYSAGTPSMYMERILFENRQII
jgi:hypothetical protein